jgi:hypothetical protein
MTFRVRGIDPDIFKHLVGLSDEALGEQGIRRYTVDGKPGFPDRVEVRDLEPGETALLLNYEHQPADTPYRSQHAIFVGEQSRQPLDLVDDLPEAILTRPISLRAFDAAGEMVDADLAAGSELRPIIARFFDCPDVAYLHAHYAKRGCYAAKIVRA